MNGIELGDYADNRAALDIAKLNIRSGNLAEGVTILEALQRHMLTTTDPLSNRLLLPEVQQKLQAIRAVEESTSPYSQEVQSSSRHRAAVLKADIVDAAIVAGVAIFCHQMLVHELLRLPGIEHNMLSANIAAAAALGLALLYLTNKTRPVA